MGPQRVPSRRVGAPQELELREEQSLKEVPRALHGATFGEQGQELTGGLW